jgi:hypothetical protein
MPKTLWLLELPDLTVVAKARFTATTTTTTATRTLTSKQRIITGRVSTKMTPRGIASSTG